MTTMNNEDPANSSLRERCDTDAAQPAGVAVDRGVRPSVWWHEQRGAFEGPQMLAPMYLLGPEKPGSYDHGATYEPLYDQAALAAERERSHELLQAADHIHAGLDAEVAALRAAVDESERERDYLRWRMREIIPLFEEARDALCAISLVAATAYRVDLSLGSRMDAAGTRTREEFEAAKEKK